MGIKYSSVVDAPIAKVFAWHERPGAVTRLIPPWQPVNVIAEAKSLVDGRTTLRLPGGLRWEAQHDPVSYVAQRKFTDQLVSRPASAAFSWRHIHRFRPGDDDTTTVIDDVFAPVPDAGLRAMFRYRHRQLADDLAAHHRLATARPLTVALSGASGLVGGALSAFLTTAGHRVVHLVRHPPRHEHQRQWDPQSPAFDLLEGVDAVIHLAGASIFGRFTAAHKQAIRDSRVTPTRKLAQLAAHQGIGTFVSASAIGFYGPDRGEETLTEDSRPGGGFLADVVTDWEGAADAAADGGVRTVQIRTGIVQTPRGGVLGLQRPLFSVGAGGRLGSGQEWLSWIGLDDLLDIYLHALINPAMSGPVNAVAPHPVRNSEYASTLAAVLRRPALVPVPRMGPRVLLGTEGAQELAEASQRVSADRLRDLDHHFRYPYLESALRHMLGR